MTLRFAVDTGGTFTDLVVEDGGPVVRFYKRPTTPANPVDGLLDVLAAAAADRSLSLSQLLSSGDHLVFGTTRATNAVVTGATARTALLCTQGHPDVLLFREGGGRSSLFDYSQEYPSPYVPRSLTFEVPERILSNGSVAEGLDEHAVRAVIAELLRREVEAVAVCLLWSTVNPNHERRIGELLAEVAPELPFTLSHALNPSLREYRRASSAAIDASLKPLMSSFFRDLDLTLRQHGFGGRLLVMSSSGGVLDAAEVAEHPIHSIGSGPAAAPVAGRHYAALDAGADTALVTDAGGTTYDVSLVRRGRIPWTRETIVSHPTYGYITGFPSIDVRSVGAGGGSIAWVDEGGLIHVGPESAGADPGPACYDRGGTHPTVTDACLVLGYIDADYFLGGEMALVPELARTAIRTEVGDPLGLDLYEAAVAIHAIAVERMVTAIEGITLQQGIDASAAVMIGGGGGAGLYSVAIARRLGVSRVIVPDVAGALSAAGAMMSDLQAVYATTAVMSTASFESDRAMIVLRELRERCQAFADRAGADAGRVEIRYSVEARYPHQVWEIEVPLRQASLAAPEELARFRADFHEAHDELFAVRDEAAPVEIVTWHAYVRCRLRETSPRRAQAGFVGRPGGGRRPAYFAGAGLVEVPVVSPLELAPDVRRRGPLIVDSPVTTLVVDQRAEVERLSSGSLLLHPSAADA